MVTSVLVIGPDKIHLERTLRSKGIAEVDVLGEKEIESFELNDIPVMDMLVIAPNQPSFAARNRIVDAAKKLYASKSKPVLQCSASGFSSIEKEFVKAVVGQHVSLLKSNVKFAKKLLYVIATFTLPGSDFTLEGLKETYGFIVPNDPRAVNFSQHLTSMQQQEFVLRVGRGLYRFLGVDDRTFKTLKSIGFSLPDHCHKANVYTKKTATPAPVAAAPVAQQPQLVAEDKAALFFGEMQRLMRTELAQLATELKADLNKAMLSQKINAKLSRLDSDKLAKFEAVLDAFAE